MANQIYTKNMAINTTYAFVESSKTVVTRFQVRCGAAWVMRQNGGSDMNFEAAITYFFDHIDLATVEVKAATGTATLNFHGYCGRPQSGD